MTTARRPCGPLTFARAVPGDVLEFSTNMGKGGPPLRRTGLAVRATDRSVVVQVLDPSAWLDSTVRDGRLHQHGITARLNRATWASREVVRVGVQDKVPYNAENVAIMSRPGTLVALHVSLFGLLRDLEAITDAVLENPDHPHCRVLVRADRRAQSRGDGFTGWAITPQGPPTARILHTRAEALEEVAHRVHAHFDDQPLSPAQTCALRSVAAGAPITRPTRTVEDLVRRGLVIHSDGFYILTPDGITALAQQPA